MPHAVPTNKKIEAGDPITIDMGCKYKGYCSDMTRTIFAGFVPEEVKPVLYRDKNTNEIKGKCKLKPYKSYFSFEIRDKKDQKGEVE